MLTAPFEYRRAERVEDVIEWLSDETRETKILAGGHSLLPLMKLRLATPAILVDVSALRELQGVQEDGEVLRVGAFTRYVELARHSLINQKASLLSQAANVVGDLQVRNRGTIGGSLCHADPAADLPAAVLALEAQLVILGPNGTRRESAEAFFMAPFVTTLGRQEILAAIEIPLSTQNARSTYLKRPHPASGYPVIGVACLIDAIHNQTIGTARLAITGIASTAFRASAAEAQLVGGRLDAETIAKAASTAAINAPLDDDEHTEYKQQLVQVYVSRALQQVAAQED